MFWVRQHTGGVWLGCWGSSLSSVSLSHWLFTLLFLPFYPLTSSFSIFIPAELDLKFGSSSYSSLSDSITYSILSFDLFQLIIEFLFKLINLWMIFEFLEIQLVISAILGNSGIPLPFKIKLCDFKQCLAAQPWVCLTGHWGYTFTVFSATLPFSPPLPPPSVLSHTLPYGAVAR